MSTPDAEWEKTIPTMPCKECNGDGYTVERDPNDPTGETPMQAQCDFCHAEGKYTTLDCVRELLSSRDTYWKERVDRVLGAMAWSAENETPEAIRVLAEIRECLVLTNEDNLK